MANAPPLPEAVHVLNPNMHRFQVGTTVELVCPVEGSIQDSTGKRVPHTLAAGARVTISKITRENWKSTHYAPRDSPPGFTLLYELKVSPPGVFYDDYRSKQSPRVYADSNKQISHTQLLDRNGKPRKMHPWKAQEIAFPGHTIEYIDGASRSKEVIIKGKAVMIASPPLSASGREVKPTQYTEEQLSKLSYLFTKPIQSKVQCDWFSNHHLLPGVFRPVSAIV